MEQDGASILDTLRDRLTSTRAGYLDQLDFNLQELLNTISGYADLIDDGTNGLAAIKAEVEGLAGSAMVGTNSAALASVLGAKNDAAASGIPTDVDTAMQYIKQLVMDTRSTIFQTRGLTAYCTVTSVTSATEFKSAGLDTPHASHHFDDYFNGWWAYVLEADQAAPLHQWRQVSDFVQTDGVVTHTAFSVGLEAGDQILLVSPMLYEPLASAVVIDNIHDTDLPAVKTDTGNIKTDTTAIIADTEDLQGNVDAKHDTDLPAVKTVVDAITAAGPTKGEMDTGHGLLATEAKQDIIDTNVDQIEVLVADKVMGRLQIATTTEDLNQGAATYDLFTGDTQAVVLEKLSVKMPTGNAGGSVTSIAIVTDDATPATIISATDGAVANLTSEAEIGWKGTLLINGNTKIRLTLAGGAHGSEYLVTVAAQCRAVVSGGYLA